MQRLLADDGCPWDREQTLESLKKYTLEEACEVMDAIDLGDRKGLREELGDLLLQIVFQAELGRREGAFGIDDVVHGICEKLVHRHPHVFGDTKVENTAEVLENWEALKKKEKGERPLLAGIPKNFPALARAQKMGEKVKKVGFDWPDASSSFAKVREEISELQEVIERISAMAPDSAGVPAKESSHMDDLKAQMTGEIGDVIFAIVNFSRHVGINAEEALQITNEKFNRRFDFVEQRVRDSGGWGLSRNLQELDGYWEEAKKRERGQTPT